VKEETILTSRRVREPFRDLLESAPDAMVIVDEGGKIVLINAQTEALFGYSRDELLGKTVDLLVPNRYRDKHSDHRSGYFHDPRVRPMGAGLDLYGRRKDGTEFPVEISLSPIQTQDGLLVSSAIRDITERAQFERALQEKNAQLEQASLAKDNFLAGMSHELRTPLNAIIGFTGTLLMRLPGPLTDDQEKQLQIIESSAQHLLSLINDILDLAKIRSGTVDLHFEPVRLNETIAEVVSSLHSLAQKKGLRFETALEADVTLHTDPRALRQILINLANNAIKYTPDGFVRIASRTNDGAVCVEVVDSGIGIKSDDQKRLFEPFSQVDQSDSRRFEGVGLGLYLSSQLAAMLHGSLTVESKPGLGSTFSLSLPMGR